MPFATLHVTVAPAGDGHVSLRYWGDDPNRFESRDRVPLAEVAGLAARAESDYYAMLNLDLVTTGRRLYDWLDGPERLLKGRLEALRGTTVALLIEAEAGLSHLPWETLHNGVTFLARGKNPPVVPVRWHRRGPPLQAPANRPLHVLFMAASPLGVLPVLDFEHEEATILDKADRAGVTLTVEETGTLADLEHRVAGLGDGVVDVLHLSGHADHTPDGPRFLAEDEKGDPKAVSAADIARAVPRRPRLAFLSGCRTGQQAAGATRSLAEELVAGGGFPAVLGWGRPVGDAAATSAAGALYERLGQGFSVPEALAHVHDQLADRGADHWHLLRLFAAGDALGPVVTSAGTPGRQSLLRPAHESRFVGNAQNGGSPVVGRSGFVGRRRLLQRLIRGLRAPQGKTVGAVLYGAGGIGKSSVALRVCDRLAEFQPAVLVGYLDEPGLLRALEGGGEPPTPEQRSALQGTADALELRLRRYLRLRQLAGCRPPLLVLDDFEQNYTPPADGPPRVTPDAQAVFAAVAAALGESSWGRCLVTCWYKLETPQAARLDQYPVVGLTAGEVAKKSRKLLGLSKAPDDQRARVVRVADGNPRLLERLDRLLVVGFATLGALLTAMEAVGATFREDLCSRALLASLPPSAPSLLAAAVVYRLPVPFAAVAALVPERSEPSVRADLTAAVTVGLCELDLDGPTFRVPQWLEPEFPPEIRPEPDRTAEVAAEAFHQVWWVTKHPTSEAESLELLRLALLCRRGDLAVPAANGVGWVMLSSHRYAEARRVYAEAIKAIGPDYRLIAGWSHVLQLQGDEKQALEVIRIALDDCPASDRTTQDILLLKYIDLSLQKSSNDEALRTLRYQLLTLEANDDVLLKAVTMGRIADVLQAQGKSNEALRIYRQECLPVFVGPSDALLKAVTMGKIADALHALGEGDEALRIRREECLPVYERLGEVRDKAMTMSKIADSLRVRGERGEALRIYREECLPVYEQLGVVRALVVCRTNIAATLLTRGNPWDVDEARDHLFWSLRESERLGFASEINTIKHVFAKLYPTRPFFNSSGDRDA